MRSGWACWRLHRWRATFRWPGWPCGQQHCRARCLHWQLAGVASSMPRPRSSRCCTQPSWPRWSAWPDPWAWHRPRSWRSAAQQWRSLAGSSGCSAPCGWRRWRGFSRSRSPTALQPVWGFRCSFPRSAAASGLATGAGTASWPGMPPPPWRSSRSPWRCNAAGRRCPDCCPPLRWFRWSSSCQGPLRGSSRPWPKPRSPGHRYRTGRTSRGSASCTCREPDSPPWRC